MAILLISGIYIGRQLSYFNQLNQAFFLLNQRKKTSASNKIDNLLRYIQEEYVDTVNLDSLSDKVVASVLEQLDPHSGFIPAKDLSEINESMTGNFDGIGVEFNILNDTIVVVAAISGGPSESLGIQSGDRIVMVDGKKVAGIKITNEDVIKRLRGKKGTKVNVEVKRRGTKNLILFTIIRDAIPINSIDVAYLITPKIGFIKISRFAATTYKEFVTALKNIQTKGAKNLIIDLRGNPGGYLEAATKIIDELLPANRLIVYTQGKSRSKEEYRSTGGGLFETGKLTVLIDEGSASASEIVAGAIQDNDRGTIIGRRSFGKGLVQEQSEFGDGSAMRLTVARYYTPSGRCIQKPYELGHPTDYYEDEVTRYHNGELYNKDSVKVNKQEQYKTLQGRTVYGGGGILPDVFIPLDTNGRNTFLNQLAFAGIFNRFALYYEDKNREILKNTYPSSKEYVAKFEVTNQILHEFQEFINQQKIKGKIPQNGTSLQIMKTQLKALVGRTLYKNEGYYPVIYQNDKMVETAIKNTE
ncbi:MAG: S41 family peptidase [Bacteroidia bacterium]|nr:S41 family peptidase [Bacteroidia bacterium]